MTPARIDTSIIPAQAMNFVIAKRADLFNNKFAKYLQICPVERRIDIDIDIDILGFIQSTSTMKWVTLGWLARSSDRTWSSHTPAGATFICRGVWSHLQSLATAVITGIYSLT